MPASPSMNGDIRALRLAGARMYASSQSGRAHEGCARMGMAAANASSQNAEGPGEEV